MLRRLIPLLGVLSLAACEGELAGVMEMDSQLQQARTVVQVVCTPDTLTVGAEATCIARNPQGATISWRGDPMILWGISNPSIADLDLVGHVTARTTGTAIISAEGARGSRASDTITVN